MAVVAVLAAIVLPILNRASESANRIKCAHNLRAIANCIALYASENAGEFPVRISDLIPTEDVSPAVFICPSSSDVPAEGRTTEEQLKTINTPGHLSYIYLRDNARKPGIALIYEPLGNHGGEGINLVYGDLTVGFLAAGADYSRYGIPSTP